MAEQSPNVTQVGPKMAPRWPQEGQNEAKMEEIVQGSRDLMQECRISKTYKNIRKIKVFGGPRSPGKPQMRPRWPQDEVKLG